MDIKEIIKKQKFEKKLKTLFESLDILKNNVDNPTQYNQVVYEVALHVMHGVPDNVKKEILFGLYGIFFHIRGPIKLIPLSSLLSAHGNDENKHDKIISVQDANWLMSMAKQDVEGYRKYVAQMDSEKKDIPEVVKNYYTKEQILHLEQIAAGVMPFGYEIEKIPDVEKEAVN